MTGEINYFENYYQKASGDADLLERNAFDYPCSSLAGFLLLYHYKKTNHPGFDKLSKKIALHFTNPLWLQFLLNQDDNDEKSPQVTTSTLYVDNTTEFSEVQADNNGAQIDESRRDEVEPVAKIESSHQENHIPQDIPEAEPGTTIDVLPEQIFDRDDKAENDKEVVRPHEPFSGPVEFEPLHTIDYFASQGINITEEPLPNDKLGNQMKSFTAWLKSMKKLHPSKPDEQNAATEQLIQNAAEESNVNTEILTEAMAEVLIKQDKKEKAIEMYNKLSLINPSKSAYFAGKIESIKSS